MRSSSIRPSFARYSNAKVIVDAVDWCRAQLSADDLAFIGTFASEIDVPLAGGRLLHLYHGSPGSNVQDVLATTDEEELERLLAGRRCRTSWRAATRTSRCCASAAARGSSTRGAWACPSAATCRARAPDHALRGVRDRRRPWRGSGRGAPPRAARPRQAAERDPGVAEAARAPARRRMLLRVRLTVTRACA